jgi:hypothetical protein
MGRPLCGRQGQEVVGIRTRCEEGILELNAAMFGFKHGLRHIFPIAVLVGYYIFVDVIECKESNSAHAAIEAVLYSYELSMVPAEPL